MKTNSAHVTSHYVAEGAPVPADLPEGVVLTGPGAPAEQAEAAQEALAEAPKSQVKAPARKRQAKAQDDGG